MNIQLTKLIPIPLRDKLEARSSDIWNQDLSLGQGEWVKIKAPSGTGKTTLIHNLYGMRDDYTGTVVWGGQDIKRMDAEQMASHRQEKVSIIFQDLRLFPSLTALENIELKRLLQPPYHTAERVLEMAAMLRVDHILQQKAAICSYGEQQRIAIIRALIQPFEWLIMDEPFSHLDKVNAGNAAQLIAEECKKRNAGLLITDLHDDQYFNYTQFLSL